MAKPKQKTFMQPFPQSTESTGRLIREILRPVHIGDMSLELEKRLIKEIISNVDSFAIETVLIDLCNEFCICLTDSSMQAVSYRAIIGLVRIHNERAVAVSEMTDISIRLLPHSLSELIIGLAVVHSDWSLIVHAPVLTYFAQLIYFKRQNFSSYPSVTKRVERSIPTELDIRETKEFAYALGRLVREYQTLTIDSSKEDNAVTDVGNAGIAAFVEYYDSALRGSVNFEDRRLDVEDGLNFVSALHEAMQHNIGREAAEPARFAFNEVGIDVQNHPVILRGVESQKALDDALRRGEFSHMLVTALFFLSPRQLEAWYFRFVLRLSDDAGAIKMNVRKNTFRTHVDRATNHFQMSKYSSFVCRVAQCPENSQRFLDLISLHLSCNARVELENILLQNRTRRRA